MTLLACITPGCDFRFSPRRQRQVFCSSRCRQRYFSLARRVGVLILKQAMAGDSGARGLVQKVTNSKH